MVAYPDIAELVLNDASGVYRRELYDTIVVVIDRLSCHRTGGLAEVYDADASHVGRYPQLAVVELTDGEYVVVGRFRKVFHFRKGVCQQVV